MFGKREHAILIIVQNLPVPIDRRVWLEAQALQSAGFRVSVICPKAPGDPHHEVLNGVHLFKYPAPPATSGLLSYLLEFIWCWLATAVISVEVKIRRGFRVIQACNPPDTFWLLARIWRLVGRTRFVYDQHDLNPELFRSRFGEPEGASARMQLASLVWLERRTYRAADRVISTNESYRRIAIERGGVPEGHVTVVRSGPNTDEMRPGPAHPELRRGTRHLLVYLGIMGPQDNVDVLLDVMEELVHRRERSDISLALLGSGDCLPALRARTRALGLEDVVDFTGRAGPAMIEEYLSTASVGLAPDLKTPLNDVSTHNKTMEYMAYALPAVAFDLSETLVTVGEGCSLIVPSGDLTAFADAIVQLVDDEDLRSTMGANARARCVAHLDWRSQMGSYVDVFRGLIPTVPPGLAGEPWPVPDWSLVGTAAHSTSGENEPSTAGRQPVPVTESR